MVLILSAVFLFPMSAKAIPAETNNPTAGMDKYVSLHKYASPTEIPGVYRIELTVTGNDKWKALPLFITFVVDASPSMYLTHLKDTLPVDSKYVRMPTADPATDEVSRWEGVWAGLRAALDIFGDPVINPAYNNTYISIVAFDGFSTRVFTNTVARGASMEKKTGSVLAHTTADSLASFSSGELSATISTPALAYSSVQNPLFFSNGYRSNYPAGTGGFVNISLPGVYNISQPSRGKLLECVPRYPMMTSNIVSNTFSVIPNSSNRTYWWLDTNGTSTGRGMQTAYQLMQSSYSMGAINGVLPSQFRRNIIFLGDGNDQVSDISQHANSALAQFYAAALKAPTTATLSSGSTNLTGLNTEIWSIGLGLDATRSQGDFYTDLIPAEPFTYLGSRGSNWSANNDYENFLTTYATTGSEAGTVWDDTLGASYIEPHLISLAMPLSNSTDYASWPTNAYTSGVSALQSYFNFYATHSIKKDKAVYEMCSAGYPGMGGVSTTEVFEKYAKSIIGENIFVRDKVGSEFDVYKFPGAPLLEVTGDQKVMDPSSSWDPGTISMSGDLLNWSIPAIPTNGESLHLKYYVKISDTAQPDVYYPTNEYAYIEYDRAGIDEMGENSSSMYHSVKYFPVPYVKLDGSSKTEDSTNPNTPMGTPESEATDSSGLIPIAGVLQNNGQPYTPSVTPSANRIHNEQLEEEAESVPVTKSPLPTAFILAIAVVSLLTTVLVIKKKRYR